MTLPNISSFIFIFLEEHSVRIRRVDRTTSQSAQTQRGTQFPSGLSALSSSQTAHVIQVLMCRLSLGAIARSAHADRSLAFAQKKPQSNQLWGQS